MDSEKFEERNCCFLPLLQPFKNGIRFMLTICGGLFVVCGSKAIGFPAAGALGCALLSIVANASWKSSNQVTEVSD